MPGSALFLDRDGVINVDRGYVHRPDQFEFVPGIFPLAGFWADELRRPIVVGQQSVRHRPWLFR
jgi:D-glycero-D-manno-heptose 1,7-bisphosphate phosphatase